MRPRQLIDCHSAESSPSPNTSRLVGTPSPSPAAYSSSATQFICRGGVRTRKQCQMGVPLP